jgi:single-strand DNA-binding protein
VCRSFPPPFERNYIGLRKTADFDAVKVLENLISAEEFMAGVNKAILIGNLGKDPELRRTPGGTPVASFPLATTERRTDRTSGQRQDRTEWHNIVAWGRLAELANQYLRKGRSAYVEGRISTRSWDDRDGNKRYRTEIVANQIQFLGGPNGPAADARSEAEVPAPEEFDVRDTVSESNAGAEDDLPF